MYSDEQTSKSTKRKRTAATPLSSKKAGVTLQMSAQKSVKSPKKSAKLSGKVSKLQEKEPLPSTNINTPTKKLRTSEKIDKSKSTKISKGVDNSSEGDSDASEIVPIKRSKKS